MEWLSYQWPSPRGGAQALTDALTGHLRHLGGEIVCGATVSGIESSLGRVTGVTLAGGGRHPGDLIIADVMPRALLDMAGGALSGWYRAGLVRFRQGPATLKLDWALDGPIPWTAPEARGAGTVHLGGGEESTVEALRRARAATLGRPFVLMGQQSVADPSRAPEGAHTAWAYARPVDRGADLDTARWVEAVEAQVERFAPGFRERIRARHVLTPAALQERDPNLVGGDVGGGSYSGLQAVFRPLPSLCPYRTPLGGLFLGSAAVFPGGGVHGVPGDAAARVALRSRQRALHARRAAPRSRPRTR